MGLTAQQTDALLAPIKPHRVLKAQGQSHVAAFDVIAHLTRLFGFGGWDKEILDLELVHERIIEYPSKDPDKAPAQRAWVTYRCTMRLTIRDPEGNVVKVTDDVATGSAQNAKTVADGHDQAIKSAASYALKRCAKDLGDQFGLSLYNKGQTSALVVKTLVHPSEEVTDDVQDHAPVPETLGNDEREFDIEDNSDLFAELTRRVKKLTDDEKADFGTFGDKQGWPEKRSEMTQAQIDDAFGWIERRLSGPPPIPEAGDE